LEDAAASFVDREVVAGGTYTYRCAALDADGVPGPPSPPVTVRIPLPSDDRVRPAGPQAPDPYTWMPIIDPLLYYDYRPHISPEGLCELHLGSQATRRVDLKLAATHRPQLYASLFEARRAKDPLGAAIESAVAREAACLGVWADSTWLSGALREPGEAGNVIGLACDLQAFGIGLAIHVEQPGPHAHDCGPIGP
jgi:hypothetical protein